MQIVPEDAELKPYIVTIKDLAELLGVPASNIYRDIEEITDDILRNPVYVREEKAGKTIRFIKMPWVTRCEYKADVGVALKLNEELKPFLINLRQHYTPTKFCERWQNFYFGLSGSGQFTKVLQWGMEFCL